MENLYDDLENYEESYIIAGLKDENNDLKKKLQQYSSTLEQLQIDFEKLSSEYKTLQLNYSSLLTTARAEIERKTNMITQLNVEKDMMVIQAFQKTGKRGYVPHYAINKVQNAKETCKKSQSIKNQPENEQKHGQIIKQPSLKRLESVDKKNNRSKTPDNSSYEGKKLYSVSSKSNFDRYNKSSGNYDERHRQKDKTHYRQSSPKRTTRHRSRSPHVDKYSRSNSRRYNYNNTEYSQNYRKTHQNEHYDRKHKLLPHSQEPNYKKMRVDTNSHNPNSELEDGEVISYSSNEKSPENCFRSCQSPDNVYCPNDVDQTLIKEIVHTASIPQIDPRMNSKKYILQKENGKQVFKSISSIDISLNQVNTLYWKIPKNIIPDNLKQKPRNSSIMDLFSENNSLCNNKQNPIENSTKNTSTEFRECRNKKEQDKSFAENTDIYSEIDNSSNQTNNTKMENICPLGIKEQEKYSMQGNLPSIYFITEDIQKVDKECNQFMKTVEADLLLSDDASDCNASKPTRFINESNECNDKIDMENKIKCTEPNKTLGLPKNSSERSEKEDIKNDLAIKIVEKCDNKNKPTESIKHIITETNNTQTTTASECVNTISLNNINSEYETKCENLSLISSQQLMISSENSFSESKLKHVHSLKDDDKQDNLQALPCKTDTDKTLIEETSKSSSYRKNKCRRKSVMETSKNVQVSVKDTNLDKNSLNEKKTLEVNKNSSFDKTSYKKIDNTSGGPIRLDSIENKSNNDKKNETENKKMAVRFKGRLDDNQQHEGSTNKKCTKPVTPKCQEAKKIQAKVENQTTENAKHKTDKNKKIAALKNNKSFTKDNIKVDETPITDTIRKFSEIFGECSNSLILPEDLGITHERLPIKFTSLCDDTQSAVDLSIDQDVKNQDTDLLKECSIINTQVKDVENVDVIKNYTEICKDVNNPVISNLYENLEPAVSLDNSNVHIISTGVQSMLTNEGVNREFQSIATNEISPPQALATSTPLKMIGITEMETKYHKGSGQSGEPVGAASNDSEVPDLRIFVKRRRKLRKP